MRALPDGGFSISTPQFAKIFSMSFPIKICVACGEEFELKPGKPGFANRCPACSEPDADGGQVSQGNSQYGDRRADSEVNAERRRVIRDMLYRKDS